MTNESIVWALGGMAAFYTMWNSAGTAIMFSLVQRVSRIEGALIAMSKNAAKALHSPDDHHGLDGLLDKYVERHHDLSLGEWQELESRCNELIHDPAVKKDESALATQILAGLKLLREVAIHKQTRGWEKKQ